jgi:hypothetical protein
MMPLRRCNWRILVGKTDTQVKHLLRYHLEKTGIVLQVQLVQLNTATSDLSVTTLFTPNKFTIFLGTVKIKDVTTTNGTIKGLIFKVQMN